MFSIACTDLFGGPGEATDPMSVASQREQGRDYGPDPVDISEDSTGVSDSTMGAGDSAEQQQVPELPGSSPGAMEPGRPC